MHQIRQKLNSIRIDHILNGRLAIHLIGGVQMIRKISQMGLISR
ncbi:hypothetical protein Syncc8109_0450 [Synechococcus sp. WH 8109]|nr:hypothetical protein Syncc8109_0450 [Synechococcus sp. WH 8109]